MFRFFLLFLFTLSVSAAADTFLGRDVLVMDGRASQSPAPLVLLLHGGLGSGAQIGRDTDFAHLSSEFGIIVAAPNGINRRWQDGRQGPERSDVDYLSALIEDFVARGLADPSRVYAIGHSNGGGMAMRMACDRPDLIAGIGVVATKVIAAFPCSNGLPMPAIFFHGTEDSIAPHSGRPAGARLGETLSSDQTAALWAERNGCTEWASVRRIDARPRDGTALLVESYLGCSAMLTRIVIEEGGHGWPGSGRGSMFGGRITREIDAGRASLRFLLH